MIKRIHQFTCFNQDADTREEYMLESFVDLEGVVAVSDYLNDEHVNQDAKTELIVKSGFCLIVMGNLKDIATLWAKYLYQNQEA